MPQEIERKFLVKNENYRQLGSSLLIQQGFLSTEKDRVVRVRIMGNEAWLTVKGITTGISRDEFEYRIPLDDAKYMLDNLCEKPAIKKCRYSVDFKGFTWEVDEYHGGNSGLVIAEVELPSEDSVFELPAWIGEEVTGDARYYNAMLVKNPYKNWRK